MKKITLLLIVAFFAMQIAEIKAQNIQVMYDFERGQVTSTLEMFRPDAGGSTYFFVDLDCAPKMTGAYWEIAREFNFWQNSKLSWLSVHLEYNGGLNTSALSFNNCWLGGITYSGHSKDFTKTWSLSALYKVIPGTVGLSGKSDIHNFQITGVWGIKFAKEWCSFDGFFDFWREARIWQGTEYIFITEPQFWVNFNQIKGCEKLNLSIGGEVEVSANFVNKGFHVLPAVGAKWTF